MNSPTQTSPTELSKNLSTLELAQALAEKMAITPRDWHKLKGNRQAQAGQQLTAALIFLLKDKPSEALERLNQAKGWLDQSISPLPCPTHEQKHKTPIRKMNR
jgi:hypothetical protein